MKPPAFRFYVDNFIEGTSNFTDCEVGLYIRLLCAQWSKGGLPNDDEELLRFSHGPAGAQPGLSPGLAGLQPDLSRVKKKFHLCEDGLLRNARLEIERAKQVSFSEAQSRKARAGLSRGSAGAQPGQCRGSAGAQPSVSVSVSNAYREPSLEVNGNPSKKEVLAKAQVIGLAPWKAEDWFNEMQGCGWLDHLKRPIVDWTAVMTRVRIKWESDGRPMSPPKPKHKTETPKEDDWKQSL